MPESGRPFARADVLTYGKVDIFHVPSHGRVHRSIGSDAFAIGEKTGKRKEYRFRACQANPLLCCGAGTIMALQLFVPATGTLHLLVGYEAGTVALFRFTDNAQAAFHPLTLGQRKEEGEGWQLVWTHQGHRETGEDTRGGARGACWDLRAAAGLTDFCTRSDRPGSHA